MSIVKANTYQDASGGSNAVFSGVASPPNSMGFRNRIINGDMRIDQRNAGASVTVNTSPVFTVDRFYCAANASGVYTAQRSTTAPAGFTNSVILTVTTPRTSIAAGDVYGIRQAIEGFNTADLGWGGASAQSVTLSFWVRSSITGTYTVSFFNAAFNRSYVATYTINAANTFEQKTITIAGDTTGTWATDNTASITVYWDLGSGSTYNGTAGAWAAAGAIRTSGSTNWISTNGATFYITGVQLEAGSVASPFERLDYGRQLLQCQRYYEQYGMQTSAAGLGYCSVRTGAWYGYIPFMVEKRAAPTVTLTGTFVLAGTAGDIGAQTPTDINEITRQACRPYKGSGSYTAQGAYFTLTTPSTDKLAISAEL
jgi:hypothetical protein